ncbi:MAG: hypothetical protein ACX98W_05100, partial [bacterium]
MAKRMEEAGLGFQDEILLQGKSKEARPQTALERADVQLERLEEDDRLALETFARARYEYPASRTPALEEMGRLHGGWQRAERREGAPCRDRAMFGPSSPPQVDRRRSERTSEIRQAHLEVGRAQ